MVRVHRYVIRYEIIKSLLSELAHMWFGNLVTMKWWSDLWLKEGFASYMSYLAIDHVRSDLFIFGGLIERIFTFFI